MPVHVDADSLTHGKKLSKCRKHTVRCGTPQALLSQIPPTTSLIVSCLARQGLERKVCNKRILFEEHVRTLPPRGIPSKTCSQCMSEKNSNLLEHEMFNFKEFTHSTTSYLENQQLQVVKNTVLCETIQWSSKNRSRSDTLKVDSFLKNMCQM